MHRLAIKRTTKNEAHTCNGVRTAPSRHSAIRCERRYVCRECRVPNADCSVRAEVCALRIWTRYDRLSQPQLSFLF